MPPIAPPLRHAVAYPGTLDIRPEIQSVVHAPDWVTNPSAFQVPAISTSEAPSFLTSNPNRTPSFAPHGVTLLNAAAAPFQLRSKLEWHAQYRTLSRDVQFMLEATADYLPSLNIFAPIDRDTLAVWGALARAGTYAGAGLAQGMTFELNAAQSFAAHMGVQMPDTRCMEMDGFAKALPLELKMARRAAAYGNIEAMEHSLHNINEYAFKAGVPRPFTAQIERQGYSLALNAELARARCSAELGFVVAMHEQICAARRFAAKISVGGLDTASIERKGLTQAMLFHLRNAHDSAMHGEPEALQGDLDNAKALAAKAGLDITAYCNEGRLKQIGQEQRFLFEHA